MRRRHPPLRVSVVGIDGAGKSSTTMRAIALLGSDFAIAKPGREPFVLRSGEIRPCAQAPSRFFESLFKRVDATRSRARIGMSRVLFVLYQGWLEPYMIRAYRPDLVVNTRCMILDPAIYTSFYYPWIEGRMSLLQKLRAARWLSRLPFRDLYIFLRTPATMAMERIRRRIGREPGFEDSSREHWLHLHEEEAILEDLARRFDRALAAARTLAPLRVEEIDTAEHDEESVARLIDRRVREAYAT